RADAGDRPQVVGRVEPAAGVPLGGDAAGQGRAHAWQLQEFAGVAPVQVDRRGEGNVERPSGRPLQDAGTQKGGGGAEEEGGGELGRARPRRGRWWPGWRRTDRGTGSVHGGGPCARGAIRRVSYPGGGVRQAPVPQIDAQPR